MIQPVPPITPLLPEIIQQLESNSTLVLQAPPGAGKTTLVPLTLLESGFLSGQKILMLEPRRLAASNAARYMAGQLGEPVGRTVGYSIRYQRKVSNATRIEVVTEGILTRRLQQDPELTGVGLVIFDEFHERHLQSDLSLALCRDVQQGLRDDLKLLVMSATLDGDSLAGQLQAPLLTSEGRSFPVDVRYLPGNPRWSLVEATVSAIRRALTETDGDLLVFLPGAGEIRRCQQQLADLGGILACPLYGNLSFAEQERAILPAEKRKVVLSTNIAETSLTIEGISVVIDSGYSRQPRFDSGSGLTRLQQGRISQASSTQRAGRAGRLGPGTCYRLWSEGTQATLLPFTPPEIRTSELAPLVLQLLAWGCGDPQQLFWLDPPGQGNWQAGLELLELLGALTPQQQLNPIGHRLANLPAHPRIGRMLIQAEDHNLLPLGCDLAALLSEVDPWQKKLPTQPSDSDLLDRLEAFYRNPDLREFSPIARASCYWRRHFNLQATAAAERTAVTTSQLAILLAAAYPDRIGKRREVGATRYQLSSGQGVRLGKKSALQNPELLIAVNLHGQNEGEAEVCLASVLEWKDLERLYPQLNWQTACYWDHQEDRIVACEFQKIGALTVSQRPAELQRESADRAILQALRQEGLSLLNFPPEVESLRSRLQFLHGQVDAELWPDFSDQALLQTLEEWLQPFLGNARNRKDLGKIDLQAALRSRLDWQQRQKLEQLAPERLQVPSGSNIRLHYPLDNPPVLAVKLQELFGMVNTPRIANGRVAVVIHLLSPAGRPLQITQDLHHFWEHSYPEVRKEMKGRYPKHPWPDDPLNALPTSKTKRKLAQQEKPS